MGGGVQIKNKIKIKEQTKRNTLTRACVRTYVEREGRERGGGGGDHMPQPQWKKQMKS